MKLDHILVMRCVCTVFLILTFSCQKDGPSGPSAPLITAPDFWDDNPAWSPDGRYVAYTYYSRFLEETIELGRQQVWIYDTEADTNYRFITPGFIPRWSPDGTILAFTFPAWGFGDIYFYYIEQDTVVRITYNGHQNYYDFAPDGNSLVMPSTTGLRLVDLEGNFYKNLTPGARSEVPRWSQYSGNVLYMKYDSSYFYQFAISDTMGNFLGLVHPSVWDQNSACFGPGDSLIAIWATNHPSIFYIPSSSIWIKNTNSGSLDLFSTGWAPDWSADGQWISFVDEARNPYRFTIWIMRPDGSGRREISQWYPNDDTTTVGKGSLHFPRCALTEQQKRNLGFGVR